MPLGMWVVVCWMLFVMFTGIVMLIWGLRNNQFDDIEEAKFRMLEDHEPQAWVKGEK